MNKLKMLGRYQIGELLGKGAFAEVYRAEDTLLKRTVALKLLKPALIADEDSFARFQQEAQAAAQLFHQQIATVLDMGETDGRFYLSMRYIEGQSLEMFIKEKGKLPWKKVAAIITQVGEALQFAHQKELIHRDVKPQNILINESEGAVLTDFGLVKALQSSGVTRTGSFLGTPGYMAPELWEGQEASQASDQYALACVLVELLSGKPLFSGTTPSIMKQHLMEEPALPVKFPKSSPSQLPTYLAQALNKQPEKRFISVAEFIDAIQHREESRSSRSKTNSLSDFDENVISNQLKKIGHDEIEVRLTSEIKMLLLRIPAGIFSMGCDEIDEANPVHQVHLSEYWIGKFTVTNQQYDTYVSATGYKAPDHWKNGRIANGKEDHPVVNVSWHEAQAFCNWISKLIKESVGLASEAEWEKAACGTDGRKYPWGDTPPDDSYCNFCNHNDGTSPVGKYSPLGDSPRGCSDMAGNVWEWTNSLYKPYPYIANDGREDPATEDERIQRGGSWGYDAIKVSSHYRDRGAPTQKLNSVGFRCVLYPSSE